MEISLRYVFIKLEAILPLVFAMFYFIGDKANDIQKIEIKDQVSILTGISISIFYLTKAYRSYYIKDKINELEERVKKLEDRNV
jgi:hypothetical protein